MSTFKTSLGAASGVLVLAAGVSLVTPRTVQSQPQTVGPDKPVLVINTVDEPVPVIDVNASRGEAFQVTADLSGEVFQVPPGKRFVIEYLSGRVDISLTCAAASLQVTTSVDGSVATHHFTLTPVVTGTLSKIFIVSAQTRLYADGEVGIANNQFGGGCTFVGGDIAFSGHLIDQP